jgi:hypothetical protein
MMKQKKGELTDIMIYLITLFVLGAGFIVIIFVIPSITGGLRTAGMNSSVTGSNAIDSLEGMTGIINYGFLFIFIGLIISMMITSFMVRTHPIFLFLYIFFLAITILLSFYLGNAYEQISANPAFATALSHGTFITLVMSHIAAITLLTGALSMIIVFSKFSTFGGTTQF